MFVAALDDEQGFDFLVSAEHLLVTGQQGIGFDDQERAAGVIEDELQFLGRRFTATRHAHRTESHECQIGNNPGVAIVRKQHDTAAARDLALFKSPGQKDDVFTQLGVVDGKFLLGDPVDKCRSIREFFAGRHDRSDHRRRTWLPVGGTYHSELSCYRSCCHTQSGVLSDPEQPTRQSWQKE